MKKKFMILFIFLIIAGCQTSSLFQKGENEYQKQNYSLSREIFYEYIEINPHSGNIDQARLNIGASYYFENAFTDAEEELTAAYKISQNSKVKEYALYLLTWTAYKNNEKAQAVYYYDKFIKEHPFSRMRMSLADIMEPLKTRPADYAGQKVRRLDAAEYLTAANAFKRAGNFNAAILNYGTALTIIPDERKTDIMIELAECYENVRDYSAAAKIYDEIISLNDKNYYRAVYNSAQLYEIRNEKNKALTNYRILFFNETNPYYEDALYKLYEYYENEKQEKELADISKRIIEFDVYSLMAEEAFNALMNSPFVSQNEKKKYAKEYLEMYPGGKYSSAAYKTLEN